MVVVGSTTAPSAGENVDTAGAAQAVIAGNCSIKIIIAIRTEFVPMGFMIFPSQNMSIMWKTLAITRGSQYMGIVELIL